MAAEPGGIASKLGHWYEQEFAVQQLLGLLTDRNRWVQWEPHSADKGGADILVQQADGLLIHYQLKRQLGDDPKWTPASLYREGVLQACLDCVRSGPEHRFAFVSTIPATHLETIAAEAFGCPDLVALIKNRIGAKKDRLNAFGDLLRRWGMDPEDRKNQQEAVRLLAQTEWITLPHGRNASERLRGSIGYCLTGDADRTYDAMASLLKERLRQQIIAADLLNHLQMADIDPRHLDRDPTLPKAVADLNDSFCDRLRERSIAQRQIKRSVATEIVDRATKDAGTKVVVVGGRAGNGKSGVLLQVVEQLRQQGTPVLALSLDRQRPGSNPEAYGRALGLKAPPVPALRAVSGDRPSVLVIDQLDALRTGTAGAAEAWDACSAILRAAASNPAMCVIVACRTFDLKNDERLQEWHRRVRDAGGISDIEVGELADEDVRGVLKPLGVNVDELPPRMQSILRRPASLHAWWWDIDRDGGPIKIYTSHTQLLRDSIRNAQRRAAEAHSNVSVDDMERMLGALAERLQDSGQSLVGRSSFAGHQGAIDAGCSEGLLISEGQRIGLPHQSYMDFLIAHHAFVQAGNSAQEVADWVRAHQILEHRDRVRHMLLLLRDEEPVLANKACEVLLVDEAVRFHLKLLILAVWREASDISDDDVALLGRLLASDRMREHAWERVLFGSTEWFDALHARGLWESWLKDVSGDRGTRVMRAVLRMVELRPKEVDDLVAPILTSPAGREEVRRNLGWSRPRHDAPGIAAMRDAAIRSGEWGIRDMDIHDLSKHDPSRAAKLAYFGMRTMVREAMQGQAGNHRDFRFELREELLDRGAAKAIEGRGWVGWRRFSRLLRLCERARMAYEAARDDESVPNTEELRALVPSGGTLSTLSKLLSHAVRGVAAIDPEHFDELLSSSAAQTSEEVRGAICLALSGADPAVADAAMQWLADDPSRAQFVRDYQRDHHGVAADAIRHLTQHCSEHVLRALEKQLLSYVPDREKENHRLCRAYWTEWHYRSPIGHAKHLLLSAIDRDRRSSEVAEAISRLDEKFGREAKEQAAISSGVGGHIGSPIPEDRIARISDTHWLEIIAGRWDRPGRAKHRWRQRGPGLVAEASHENFASDFGRLAGSDPPRFARLARKIPPDAPLDYLQRLWMAFASKDAKIETCAPSDLEALIVRAVEDGDRECLRWACGAIENHHDTPWGERVWDLLGVAIQHPDPDPTDLEQQSWGDSRAHRLDTTALNCVRGEAAAALAMLVWDDRQAYEMALPLLTMLADDPHPAIRMAVARAALSVASIDEVEGAQLLSQAMSHPDDTVLAGHWPQRVVQKLRWRKPDEIRPILRRMSVSEIDEVAEKGAFWTTAEHFQQKALSEVYEACRSGRSAQRLGVARLVRGLVAPQDEPDGVDRDEVAAALIERFDDDDESIRTEAANTFREKGVLESSWGPQIAEAFVKSRAFVENVTDLIWTLKDFPGDISRYTATVLSTASRLATEFAADTHDIRTGRMTAVPELPGLLLKIYAKAQKNANTDIAIECLDCWDAMLANRVAAADEMLDGLPE